MYYQLQQNTLTYPNLHFVYIYYVRSLSQLYILINSGKVYEQYPLANQVLFIGSSLVFKSIKNGPCNVFPSCSHRFSQPFNVFVSCCHRLSQPIFFSRHTLHMHEVYAPPNFGSFNDIALLLSSPLFLLICYPDYLNKPKNKKAARSPLFIVFTTAIGELIHEHKG